jgi:hypothetical protein
VAAGARQGEGAVQDLVGGEAGLLDGGLDRGAKRRAVAGLQAVDVELTLGAALAGVEGADVGEEEAVDVGDLEVRDLLEEPLLEGLAAGAGGGVGEQLREGVVLDEGRA